jgi:hypothetical protein
MFRVRQVAYRVQGKKYVMSWYKLRKDKEEGTSDELK